MKYFLLLLHSNYLNQTLAVGSLDLGRGDILSVVAKGYRWAGSSGHLNINFLQDL
jgi:hypothetical protein